jgi:hypothetical protein
VYYDATEPTFVFYQCFELPFLMNQLISEGTLPWWVNSFISSSFVADLHYSVIAVGSQNPKSTTAKGRVDTFINGLTDRNPSYVGQWGVGTPFILWGFFAYFGWSIDSKTYSTSDLLQITNYCY